MLSLILVTILRFIVLSLFFKLSVFHFILFYFLSEFVCVIAYCICDSFSIGHLV